MLTRQKFPSRMLFQHCEAGCLIYMSMMTLTMLGTLDMRHSRAKGIPFQDVCPSVVKHYVWRELSEGGCQTLFQPG